MINLGSVRSFRHRNNQQKISSRNLNTGHGVSTEAESNSHAGFIHDLIRKRQPERREYVKHAIKIASACVDQPQHPAGEPPSPAARLGFQNSLSKIAAAQKQFPLSRRQEQELSALLSDRSAEI